MMGQVVIHVKTHVMFQKSISHMRIQTSPRRRCHEYVRQHFHFKRTKTSTIEIPYSIELYFNKAHSMYSVLRRKQLHIHLDTYDHNEWLQL